MITWRNIRYLLGAGVIVASLAGVSLANEQGMESYGPSDSVVSSEVGMSEAGPGTVETHADAWELRESMETGALPDRPESLSDAECCRGIDEPTIGSGGLEFRPEIDAGP
ncbi:MAG: hypothetical protein OHK0028_09750 [Deltaproteobacteria bacterium]